MGVHPAERGLVVGLDLLRSAPALTLTMRGDTATPANQTARLVFTPPAGSRIRDFAFTRQIYYYNPVRDSGTSPPYILYWWGSLPYAGAGKIDSTTRDAINAITRPATPAPCACGSANPQPS